MSSKTAIRRKSNKRKVSRRKLQAGKQEYLAGERRAGGMSSKTAIRRKSSGVK